MEPIPHVGGASAPQDRSDKQAVLDVLATIGCSLFPMLAASVTIYPMYHDTEFWWVPIPLAVAVVAALAAWCTVKLKS